jgi:hypothetical protein
LLLTLACGNAEHRKDDNVGSGGAGAGGASSSAGQVGSAAGAAGAIPIDALAKPWATAVCQYLARCFPFDAFAHVPGGCLALEQPRFEYGSIPRLKAEIASGKLSYQPDKIGACLNDFVSAPCGSSDSQFASCLAAIDGTVAIGGACTSELQCAGDAHCDVSASCPSVCEAPLDLAATCSSNQDCRAGLSCAFGTSACTAFAKKGEACRGATLGECGSGLVCVGASGDVAGSCQAIRKVQLGEPCDITSATICADGLACVIVGRAANDAAQQICVAPTSSRGPCSIGEQDSCPRDEYCPLTAVDLINGVYTATCRPIAKEGETCVAGTAACGATGACRSDSHCIELRKIGEACQADSECYSDTCIGGVCLVDPGCR